MARGGGRGGECRWDRSACLHCVTCFVPRMSFMFLFLVSNRPKKRFHGKDCCSLAVTIGAGMDLHPILLHSTRRQDKLGLLSLDKYNLSLVMGFLCAEQVGWQAILPSFRATKYFVAPLPSPTFFSSFTCGSLVFSFSGLCSGVGF